MDISSIDRKIAGLRKEAGEGAEDVARLAALIARMEATAVGLEETIASEEKRTGITDKDSSLYSEEATSAATRLRICRTSIDEVLTADLEDARSEVKRVLGLLESALNQKKRMMRRLDEEVANNT